MRLSLEGGRFHLAMASVGQIKPPQAAGAWSEKLSLTSRGGQGVLDYSLELPDRLIQIRSEGGNDLSVLRKPVGESPVGRLEFTQRAGEPLRLVSGEGPAERTTEANSFWHLLLSQPAQTEELLPMLKWMAAGGSLAPSAMELEESLVRLALEQQWLQRQQWTEWVQQLADDRFAVREAADRRLRSAGILAVPFLEGLDFRHLDAEQQYRLRRIRLALERGIESSSAQFVAGALLGDRDVWLILMQREQEAVRRAAAQQLGLLRGEPVAFDPAADAALRAQQLDELRQGMADR